MAEHKTHWKKMTNTNYFGSWDLEAGKDMIVLIKEVRKETIQNAQGREEKAVAYLDGGLKPLILNTTNLKAIAKALGSPYIEDWAGRKIQLYTEKVAAFGEITEAVRVRDFDPEAAK